jgi:hypothetical protein
VLERAAVDGRTAVATLEQRVAADASAIAVAAPLAAGTALQIVDGDLGGGTRLEPVAGRTLEKRVGYAAPPGASHAARAEARRLTGYEEHVTSAAIYVRGDDVKALGGLSAAIETPRSRGRGVVLAGAAVFVTLVGALVLAVRRLRHAAELETADAVLAAELDALTAPRVERG